MATRERGATLRHRLEAKPFEPQPEITLPTSDAMLAFINSELLKHPEKVGLNPEYLYEPMGGSGTRAALARALLARKLWHFDVYDGYRVKHGVDLTVGLVNPLDWLNVLMLLCSNGYEWPIKFHYKPPRTTSNYGVFRVSFPSAIDRIISLWEMVGEVIGDPIIKGANVASGVGSGAGGAASGTEIFEANNELVSPHGLIADQLL